MDKISYGSARFSYDSRRASKGARRQSKGSRSYRDSKSSKISSIKEEDPLLADCANYRQKVTDMFFESFYTPAVLEKVSIKLEDLEETMSSLLTEYTTSSSNLLGSYSSSFDGTLGEERSLSYNSKGDLVGDASQKQSSKSNQSIDEDNSNISCVSQCVCCWRVLFHNGNVYEGQLDDLIMNGKGIFYWTDGALYRGEFKNGYPSGQGKLLLPDLSIYEGEFRLGFFDGHGKLSIKSSSILFNGEWKISQRTGKGWCLYDTNNWYEGDWLDNKKHGNGYRQYANGNKYQGNWQDDKINGQGCMMYNNNDYYNGEWKDGFQGGYGEYTWNIIPHTGFIFPNYNWYKGTWMNGKRSGIGVMNFGHESGAKLVGSWNDNKKDGPGVMVCGNGMLIEKNPLFQQDKPSVYLKGDPSWTKNELPAEMEVIDIAKENAITRFKSISQQIINKKVPMENLDTKSLTSITMSGANINTKQYIKLLDQKSTNDPPLKIPIHNVIHEVSLDYFIDEFIRRPYTESSIKKNKNDLSVIEIEHMIRTMAEADSSQVSPSCINYLPSNTEVAPQSNPCHSASEHSLLNINEVKNLIINYLPQLRNIYKTYASMCANEPLTCEPVLIRLFLWQLYRDIGVTDKGGVSIIEVDEILHKNPTSCLESKHSPWEPIYFWQFLQAIVGVACILYHSENHMYYTPSAGFMYYMFKNFLDHRLLPNAGVYQGNCLTHLRDLAPVEAVYKMYKEIGEPHTVEVFLKNTCLKPGQRIQCYKLINQDTNFEPIDPRGRNITVLNHEPSYFSAPLEGKPVPSEENKDRPRPYEGLYIFTKLGRKKIIKSLAKICPQIMSTPSIRSCQWFYRLSFIEFYEAVLLLTFEKVEQDRLLYLEDLMRHPSISEKASREGSRMSTHSTKRKKSTKFTK